MTYTFGRQVPTGYYAYLNRKGTLIIGRQTFDGRCNIFSGSYSEAKERGLINRLAFDAPRIHRNEDLNKAMFEASWRLTKNS